jgi:hypothetical protein
MNAEQIIDRLEQADVSLWIDGGRLRYSAPQALTDEQAAWLKQHKGELLLHLSAPPEIRPRLERVLQRLLATAMHEYRHDYQDLAAFSDDELEVIVLDLFALRRWRDLSATHPEVAQ